MLDNKKNNNLVSILKMNHINKEMKKILLDLIYLLEKEKVDIHHPEVMQKEIELEEEIEELVNSFKRHKTMSAATIVKKQYKSSTENIDRLLKYSDEYIGKAVTDDFYSPPVGSVDKILEASAEPFDEGFSHYEVWGK